MKFILLVIGIILLVLVFKGSSESFEVNQAIFNKVEIPTDSELQKDPYYQFIKNIDFPCKNNCPSNSTLDSFGYCVCNEGFSKPVYRNGRIDPCYRNCPGQGQMDPIGNCSNPCPGILNSNINSEGQCECRPGYRRDRTKTELTCLLGCPENSSSGLTEYCVCNEGYDRPKERSSQGDPCYPKCPVNYDMDINGECKIRQLVCPIGTTYSYNPNTGGKCITETNDGGLRTQLEIEQMLGGITG